MHRTTPQFWGRFNELDKDIQALARKNFELLKENPRHPSLQFKKESDFWSASIIVCWQSRITKTLFGYGLAAMQNMTNLFREILR